MDKPLPELGAEPRELAAAPELMIDLALSLAPRRLCVASALLTLLGGYSRDKVQSIFAEIKKVQAELANPNREFGDLLYSARDLLAAVAKLENAVFTLVIARIKHGRAIVPRTMSA
ncbi:hypothetical protein VT84_03505 [Gemmata sp. SH-PL17]|uniref:hypothetical protein n=1 Tax=Gemmata sp. SH-PL17 TaxID=1630693 RepID=UPI00078E2859|nr:hypothetical protein [Gemmata sp. SH-PL17]AMV23450.1 hypothetical protein VT84_03505 [Gemmata sp. SH-PL17]